MARAAVGPLFNTVKQAGKTFAGVWDEANQATMWLTEPSLAFMVSGSNFLTTDICKKQAITLMFHLPLDLLQTYPALGRVLFGSFVSAKIASGTANWVLLCPDEPWALGKAKWMEIVVAAGRKHGLAMHAPWLDVGTLERIWGGKAWRDFWFSNARCVIFSRLNDPAIARDISQACGQHGVLAYAEGNNKSVSIGTGWGRGSRGSTENLHEIKRDVLMPYEIIQDMTRDDLLVLGLGKPLWLNRAIWQKYPDLRRGIMPTQYKEGKAA
jgi:type IV secretion system protein VirD4